MKFAIVAVDSGLVTSLVEAATIESLMLNCPAGHEPHPCDGIDVRPGEWSWNGSSLAAIVQPGPTIAEVEATLLREVKGEAERLKMQYASPGGMKKAEYAGKAAEVATWDTLNGATLATVAQVLIAINGWSPDKRAATFPWAIADAKERGDTIDKAIGRFRAGITGSSKVHAIAAREGTITDAIKAAKTIADKKAVRAAAKWPA